MNTVLARLFVFLMVLLPTGLKADTLELYRQSQVLLKLQPGDTSLENRFAEIHRQQHSSIPTRSYLRAIVHCSKSFLVTGRFAQARSLCRKGISYARKNGFRKEEGILNSNLGITWMNLGRADSAIFYFELAGRIFVEVNDKKLLASSHQNIGSILLSRQQNQKAFEHFVLARKKFIEAKDSMSAAYADINLAIIAKKNGHPGQAQALFEKCYALSLKKNDAELRFAAAGNLADLWNEKNSDNALPYLNDMLAISGRLNSKAKKALAYLGLSKVYHSNNDVVSEKKAIDSAIALGEKSLEKFRLVNMYKQAADLYAQNNSYEKASLFYQKHLALLNETGNQEMNRMVLETEARFNNARKNLEMERQEKELARRNGLIILAVSLLVVLALLTLVLVYRHKKNMQLVKKEHELSVARSVLQAEEKERLRTARELHDGAGAMLAAVKMQFTVFSKTHGFGHNAQFNNALENLSRAATDIRRISHNLQPALLVENGLCGALEKYFALLPSGQTMQVHYQNLAGPLLDVYGKGMELHLLRMIQELTGNALQHSRATYVHIQVSKIMQQLVVSYEDNGIGFDIRTIKKGAGFIHLHDRAASLGGKINIDANINKGVSVLIYLPVHE